MGVASGFVDTPYFFGRYPFYPVMQRSPVVIVIESDLTERRDKALEFAQNHNLKVKDQVDTPSPELVLAFRDDVTELRDEQVRPGRGMFVDYSSIDLRTGAGNLSRKQPLPRAIGKETKTVLDATAGFGYDAVLLACMGFEVQAVERSPVIAALLEDGLRRALLDEGLNRALGDRLRIQTGDSRDILEGMDPKPDAVYIDPMFPEKRKKSALAKKHIRLVRQIVGEDPDAGELLEVAMLHVRRRVVVKRPTHAEPLAGDPDLSFGGKLVRYDVYLPASTHRQS
ncbi:MAG: class I SAM-dependent methyltransferase [Planctomycetes bacterium]|nr:class I SAM-dependent methyltransferase [Planctomycetota bacterium]